MLEFPLPFLVLRCGHAVAEDLQIIRQAHGWLQRCLEVFDQLLSTSSSGVWELKVHLFCQYLLGQTQPLDVIYYNGQLEDLVAVPSLVRVH